MVYIPTPWSDLGLYTEVIRSSVRDIRNIAFAVASSRAILLVKLGLHEGHWGRLGHPPRRRVERIRGAVAGACAALPELYCKTRVHASVLLERAFQSCLPLTFLLSVYLLSLILVSYLQRSACCSFPVSTPLFGFCKTLSELHLSSLRSIRAGTRTENLSPRSQAAHGPV